MSFAFSINGFNFAGNYETQAAFREWNGVWLATWIAQHSWPKPYPSDANVQASTQLEIFEDDAKISLRFGKYHPQNLLTWPEVSYGLLAYADHVRTLQSDRYAFQAKVTYQKKDTSFFVTVNVVPQANIDIRTGSQPHVIGSYYYSEVRRVNLDPALALLQMVAATFRGKYRLEDTVPWGLQTVLTGDSWDHTLFQLNIGFPDFTVLPTCGEVINSLTFLFNYLQENYQSGSEFPPLNVLLFKSTSADAFGNLMFSYQSQIPKIPQNVVNGIGNEKHNAGGNLTKILSMTHSQPTSIPATS